ARAVRRRRFGARRSAGAGAEAAAWAQTEGGGGGRVVRSGGWLRFALEVAFIVMVAAGAAAARLSAVGIALALAGVFLLIAVLELVWPRLGAWRPPRLEDLRRRLARPAVRTTPGPPGVRVPPPVRPQVDVLLGRRATA